MQEERRRSTGEAPSTPAPQGGGAASPPHADGGSDHAAYSEGGKAHYEGQDVTAGRSSPRTLRPDPVGSAPQQPTSLRGIANKARVNKPHRFRELSRCLDAERVLDCWQDLNTEAASGVDPGTVEADGANLHAHSEALVQRLKAPRYRAQWVRRCSMPKENGQVRALGMPALEDKRVQLACAKLLTALYAQDFRDCRYGSRPGRGAVEAVRARTCDRQYGTYGDVVEVDVKGFFDQLTHTQLEDMLRVRIDARAFLKLIRKWLKAGSLDTDGHVVHPDTGTPQGGTGSPVLANAYGHYALDLWCAQVVKVHCRGEALLCRSAAEWVCAFRSQEDAERFSRVLPQRFAQFNLQVAPEKTRLLRFSRFHPSRQRRFPFLGCEFAWMPERQDGPRVKRRTARKKLQAACQRITAGIKQPRHRPGRECYRRLPPR
jgi:RNA-directed DNA polymerase